MTDATPYPEEVTQTGTCDCGAPVTRTFPAAFARLFQDKPFMCDPCITRADEADKADAAAFEHDRNVRMAERRLRDSEIPAKYADLTLEAMDVSVAHVAAARAWVDLQPRQGGTGLLLSGPVGVGKSHLAAATAGTFIRSGGSVCWLSGPVMFARLQSPLGSDEHNKIVRVLAGKVPLVIDDIDKARPTAYGAENVFVAIDSRVSNLIPLIVTTNLDLDELAQHWPEPYGEAIVSRIAGYCRHVRLTGHDRRIAA